MLNYFTTPFHEGTYSQEKIGGNIHRVSEEERQSDIVVLGVYKFALMVIAEDHHTHFRDFFYNLYVGKSWEGFSMIDLGNISEQDAEYFLPEIISTLLKENVIPIVVGKHQKATYQIYQGFVSLEKFVSLVCVDALLDLGTEEASVDETSYLSQIFISEPNFLEHFASIGYQNYLNSVQAISLLQNLNFDLFPLGEITFDRSNLEPVLRDANFVSLDMLSVKSSILGEKKARVSGFCDREICSVARYAGASPDVVVFSVFETPETIGAFQLLSEVIWYFVDGYFSRVKEYPNALNINFNNYQMNIDNIDFVFFESKITARWWIVSPSFDLPLVSCTKEDYINALNGIIPERWWRVLKRHS